MLAQVNTYVGSVSTDPKSRTFNFLRCLNALATAAANGSPVVNPVTPAGVANTNFNCITIISNSEAGGWLNAANNTVLASTTYSNNASTPYLVDLYRSTGKSAMQWYRVTMGTTGAGFLPPNNPSPTFPTGANTNVGAAANNMTGFNQFPTSVFTTAHMGHYSGVVNSNPATTLWTTGRNAANTVGNMGANPTTGPSGTSVLRPLDFSCDNTSTYWQSGSGGPDLNPGYEPGGHNANYYVAVTQNYIIIVHGLWIYYYGLRTVDSWENTVNHNPPWCHFEYTFPIGGWTGQGAWFSSSIAAYGSGRRRQGNEQLSFSVVHGTFNNFHSNTSSNTYNRACAITGIVTAPTSGTLIAQGNNIFTNGLAPFELPKYFRAGSTATWYSGVANSSNYTLMQSWESNTVIRFGSINIQATRVNSSNTSLAALAPDDIFSVDTNSGLNTPFARPIEIVGMHQYGTPTYVFKGTLRGIYQGMACDEKKGSTVSIRANTAAQFAASEYTINNEQYVPVLTGGRIPDVYFLRKA